MAVRLDALHYHVWFSRRRTLPVLAKHGEIDKMHGFLGVLQELATVALRGSIRQRLNSVSRKSSNETQVDFASIEAQL